MITLNLVHFEYAMNLAPAKALGVALGRRACRRTSALLKDPFRR